MGNEQQGQQYATEDSQLNSYSDKSISWTASEYIEHEKPQFWYILFVVGTAMVTGFVYLVVGDILAAFAVLVAAFSAGFFASRPPSSKVYKLSNEGLSVDDKSYNLGNFKSFSVVEEGAIDSIWLKPLGRFKPYLIIYFSPQDEEKIIGNLSYYLPNEPRELDYLSRVLKRLRF